MAPMAIKIMQFQISIPYWFMRDYYITLIRSLNTIWFLNFEHLSKPTFTNREKYWLKSERWVVHLCVMNAKNSNLFQFLQSKYKLLFW